MSAVTDLSSLLARHDVEIRGKKFVVWPLSVLTGMAIQRVYPPLGSSSEKDASSGGIEAVARQGKQMDILAAHAAVMIKLATPSFAGGPPAETRPGKDEDFARYLKEAVPILHGSLSAGQITAIVEAGRMAEFAVDVKQDGEAAKNS